MRWPLFQPPDGWRGFLADVAVVVIGVVLALLAQEFAQSLQWNKDVAAQRGALRAMAEDNLKVIAFRRFQEPCVERRLAEVETIFRLHRGNQPILRQAFGEARALDARIKGVVDEALTSNNLGLPLPTITQKDVPTEEEWGEAFCRPLIHSDGK